MGPFVLAMQRLAVRALPPLKLVIAKVLAPSREQSAAAIGVQGLPLWILGSISSHKWSARLAPGSFGHLKQIDSH